MITAEEQLNRTKICVLKADSFNSNFYEEKDVLQDMIEFAKLHVEKALQKAYKNARIENENGEKAICFGGNYDKTHRSFSICKHSITNAYPLDNIK